MFTSEVTPQAILLAALPYRLYTQSDEMITFGFLIHFQFAFKSPRFTEFAFDSNWLNANSMWIELQYCSSITSHMRVSSRVAPRMFLCGKYQYLP